MNALNPIARGIAACVLAVAAVRVKHAERRPRIGWAVPGAEIPFGLIVAIEQREMRAPFRDL
jgi:hypothetical protein